MFKKLLIALISLAYYGIAHSQIPSSYDVPFIYPAYDSGHPEWVYVVHDETNIGFDIEQDEDFQTDGYNIFSSFRPLTWKPIVDGNYVYTVGMTQGNTKFIYGGIVQKIDLQTGMPVWTSVFDNRHIDHQEFVQQVELNEAGQLEVITHRRVIPHTEDDVVPSHYNRYGDDSTISRRLYDTTTGALIYHDFHSPQDNDIVQVIPKSEMEHTFYKNKDGSFQYIVNNANTEKRILKYDISSSGTLMNEYVDTFYYDESQYALEDISVSKTINAMYKPNEDSLLTLHYFELDSTGRFLPNSTGISLYDKSLNRIKFIDFVNLFEHYENNIWNIELHGAWDNRFLLEILTTNGTGTYVSHVYMDYDGNILCTFDGNLDEQLIDYSIYDKKLDTYIAFVFHFPQNNLLFQQDCKLDMFTYIDNQWIKQHTLDFAPNHYIRKVWTGQVLDNGDLLLCYDHRNFDNNNNEGSKPSEIWVRIDGNQLGFPSNTNIIETASIQTLLLTPNPAREFIHIQNLKPNTTRLRLTNIHGQFVKERTITSNSIKIDIQGLPPGIYLFSGYNHRGEQIQQGKLVKQ